MTKEYRLEQDSMGEFRVPADVYYGAQTARAVDNFPVSGAGFPREFIRALGLIKAAAAHANRQLEQLDDRRAVAIQQAAEEVADGRLDRHFVVDIFQTGSGTSTNMNANEVIANRANELLGGKIGDKQPVHPNDHVNRGQSSNDVIPTALHVACTEELTRRLLPAMEELRAELAAKAAAFDDIVKIGRTHLQDATPIRLGQEFGGYASQLAHGMRRLENTLPHLWELAIGGTAVGTGINTHPQFARHVVAELNRYTGGKFTEAENHFEAQSARDTVVELSGALRVVAVSLMKIANDIRWLGSGPRCGLGEIALPAVQPGSSIMPGKVNPVIAESVCQVAAQVMGNDMAVTVGGQSGTFELNVMMPLMARNILESLRLLTNVCRIFRSRCIAGLTADRRRCEAMVEQSLAMCTSLAPVIGYDQAAQVAKIAWAEGRTVREVVRERKLLTEEQERIILNPRRMTEPGVAAE
ncbi:MAG: class II fumarate hydratase [Acidobacteria bacterium]|nr:class II fumarate hydratase [Acidobacteriota bacterium]